MTANCRFLLGAFVLAVSIQARAQFTPTNGLYARFTTSMGEFTCKLRPDHAPRTVANFVGLAEGSQTYFDFAAGRLANRPFYTDITFHRVATNFVIQAGSPNGQGTDGPGYVFANEVSPQLRHNAAGVLSMANSGPDSNGSQFFITLAPASFLDDSYSVFGAVVDGMSVVDTIGKVPTSGEKPLTPVVIQKLEILRVGDEFAAYDPATVSPPLPAPRYIHSELTSAVSNKTSLAWSMQTNCLYRIAAATQLGTNWLYTNEFVNKTNTFTGIGPAANPTYFFQLLETQYDAVDW